MAYRHGVYNVEQPTSMPTPQEGRAAIQVIIGTAPIHLAKDPASAVNKPILCSSYKEAVEAFGYSDDFDNFTLCQSIQASFGMVRRAPLADLDRSICLLLSTRAGTIPLDRELGLSMDFIDMPPETAKSLYTAEVSEKIAKFIPGVRVKSVSWDKGNNGKMKSKVVIAPLGTSGMYMTGECYKDASGKVHRCLQDNVVYDASALPSAWEDAE